MEFGPLNRLEICECCCRRENMSSGDWAAAAGCMYPPATVCRMSSSASRLLTMKELGLAFDCCCCWLRRAWANMTEVSRLELLLLVFGLELFRFLEGEWSCCWCVGCTMLIVSLWMRGGCWCNCCCWATLSWTSCWLLLQHFFDVMWLEKEPEWEKRLPQLSHLNGFSPVWIRVCSCFFFFFFCKFFFSFTGLILFLLIFSEFWIFLWMKITRNNVSYL